MGTEWVGLLYWLVAEAMFSIYFVVLWYLNATKPEVEPLPEVTDAPSSTVPRKGCGLWPSGYKLMQAGRLLVPAVCRPQRRVLLDFY